MDIKFYRCEICGNIFEVVNDAGVTPECCGNAMTELAANTTDGAAEKHVPAVSKDGSKIVVNIGEVDHPMLEEHYIEWILVTDGVWFTRKNLKPGEKPHAEFETGAPAGKVTVYEYCNLHGLWKAEA
jgi:superoxide reductase